jgi:hypothetical protein
MKFILRSLAALTAISLLTFTGCTPEEENESELITSVTLTLTPSGGGTPIVCSFEDPDGDGGTAPTITVSDSLMSGTTYTGGLTFFNKSVNPAEDITLEVKEEGAEHQIFYVWSPSTGAPTVAYTDTDTDGKPIGVSTTVTTTGAHSGTLTVVLRHEPNKSATGVAEGNIANAGGETDVEVTFSIVVK